MRISEAKARPSAQDRLSERVFLQSITVSILGILLCIVALCSATWAWFSADVTSPANNIQSSYCDVTVSVTQDGAPVGETVDGKYLLEQEKDYVIQLNVSGTARSSYCVLVVDGVSYYTEQIDGSIMTFTVQFSRPTEVEILPRWGTSAEDFRAFSHEAYYVDLVKATSAPSADTETVSISPEERE